MGWDGCCGGCLQNMLKQEKSRSVKVFYLDEQKKWREYAETVLGLAPKPDGSSLDLTLTLLAPLPPACVPLLPLAQIYREEEKCLVIGAEMISGVQRMEDSLVALRLEEWDRVLALSFRSEEFFEIVVEQVELEVAASSRLPCELHLMLTYIAEELQLNLYNVEWFFTRDQYRRLFLTQAKTASPVDQNHAFKIAKAILAHSDKQIIAQFLSDDLFLDFLAVLSLNNEFGDRRIDYAREFQQLPACRYVLALEDPAVERAYLLTRKVRFVWDVATAMFSEMNTQAVFQEIVADCHLQVLEHLGRNPHLLAPLPALLPAQSVLYLELFSQLWEMFKSLMTDHRTKEVKVQFHAVCARMELLAGSFEAVLEVGGTHGRLIQKWLQAVNPILSFRWGEAQEWLLSLHLGVKVHIAQVLLAVLGNCDYNTKALVLLFGRNLAEVTDNRPTMRQAFLNYLHNELFSRLAPFFTTPSEIAVLVEFFIRLYKIDPQRTRRSLLEGGLLPRIEAAIGNKYVAIAAVKLLRNFLEGSEAVFSYLRRHEHFKFLQERYQEVRGGVGRGVLHSLFSNLLREAGRSDNKAGAKFIHDLITA